MKVGGWKSVIVLETVIIASAMVAGAYSSPSSHTVTIHERVSLSRTCPNGGRWYLDESDSDTAMLICTYESEDEQ